MASIEEVYEKVAGSDEEKAAFAEASKTKEGLQAFLAERGCDATAEEAMAFLATKVPVKTGELADDELDDVAGGSASCYHEPTKCESCGSGNIYIDEFKGLNNALHSQAYVCRDCGHITYYPY